MYNSLVNLTREMVNPSQGKPVAQFKGIIKNSKEYEASEIEISQRNTQLLSAWIDQQCIGPADSIVIFNESFPTVLYQDTNKYYPIPSCGLNPDIIPLGCCLSSLDISKTDGYQSFSRNYIEPYTVSESMPIASVNQQYCRFQVNGVNQYQEIYIISSGNCVEQTKCFTDHVEIYTGNQCTGLKQVFNINNTIQTINSSILGMLTVSLEVVSEARMEIAWTAFIPQEDFVPDLSKGLVLFTMIFTLIVLVSNVALAVIQTKEYQTTRRRMDLWHLVLFVFWIFKTLYFFFYVFTTFTDPLVLAIVISIFKFTNIGTLMTSTISCFILFRIFNINSRVIARICLSALVVVHFGLCIPSYMTAIIQIIDPQLYIVYSNIGNTLYNIWLTLSICFDYIPMLYILFVYFRRELAVKQQEDTGISTHKKTLFVVIIVELVTGISFTICNFKASMITRNDYDYYSVYVLAYSLYVLHTLLNVLLYKSLTNLTRELVGSSMTQSAPTRKVKKLPYSSGKQSHESDYALSKTILIR
ncbi:hypothetical protein HDV04_005939 [Boothiomyces sp. JEL0838]|nr:hypothetical protein HDV04_005939 [Boothiomyces sp. JEL0838]